MKFSEQWLHERTKLELDIETLSAQLVMAGLEVESVVPVADTFQQVIIGQVLKTTKHPDAEKLTVCDVDVGQKKNLQIVCGADNVAANLKVAVAVDGAKLAEQTITTAQLKGKESQGMLCSSKELGLSDSANGILILPHAAPVGTELWQFLQLDDQTIDVDLTPNRGDCLSVEGIAREVAVANKMELQPLTIPAVPATIKETFPVKLTAAEQCPQYVGRVIRNINMQAQTPVWLQERLRRSGLRSISPVVDVTNYVMLELGQPMHAFDLAQLSHGIEVRLANKNETIELLDGQAIKLDSDTLLIADDQRALAMAGIMGGLNSGVTDATQHIFLESAFFNPITITEKSRHYLVHTDSSHRFARGVDPQLQVRAIERATALLLEIVGGEAGPVSEVSEKKYLPPAVNIKLRHARIQRVLGLELAEQEVESILTRLGMALTKQDGGWQVSVPSYRFDISLEIDLIEELCRIHGYNNVPNGCMNADLLGVQSAQAPAASKTLRPLRSLLIARGYQEVINYSFIGEDIQQLFDPNTDGLKLVNPISHDMAVMRTNLWPGLLSVARHNQYRQQQRMRLFETGMRFVPGKKELQQQRVISGVLVGDAYPEQWGEAKRNVDFYDVKAEVEAIYGLANFAIDELDYQTVENAALHPGQSANIISQGKQLGCFGALHPRILHELDIVGPIYLFELLLAPLEKIRVPKYQHLSKYPSIRRDISLLVDQSVSSSELAGKITDFAGNLLIDITIFDVYQGAGIAENKKSLAFGLILQHSSRTLLEEEVENLMQQVTESLENQYGAIQRS